ncbi:hypothetical protein ACFW1A_07565 [Kitasatospora sp. NPDC058965]|uniref:hypothetical protein n=1 Tax=Kitasatospora sp. NPDC058965 TaxID=3346682 RepID=UPI0036CD15A2
MKDFRSDLSEELASQDPPPLGGLVPAAIRGGRRTRRIRRAGGLTGSMAALTAAGLLLGGPLSTADRSTVPAAAAAALSAGPSAAGPSPAGPSPASSPGARSAGAPAPGTVPTSPEALLAALLHALPTGGTTGTYAGEASSGPDWTVAQTYRTTAAGTGMIRVFLHTADPDRACGPSDGCFRDRRGQAVRVEHVPGNCIEDTVVLVTHPDGTEVQLDLSTCLAWDGRANLPGVRALTEDQAVEVAGDPAISRLMTPAQGAAAARQFPQLPRLTS